MYSFFNLYHVPFLQIIFLNIVNGRVGDEMEKLSETVIVQVALKLFNSFVNYYNGYGVYSKMRW